MNALFCISGYMKLHALTEVIWEFYEWNINSLSKNEKVRKKNVNKSLNQNWFVFSGQTIDVWLLIL